MHGCRQRWMLQTRLRPGCRLSASPSCGLLAAKDHASGSALRHGSVLLVGYDALYVADGAAPPHDDSFRSELRLPDRSKEIDFQFHRSEGFLRSESDCKRYSHSSVRYVAKNPPVQRSQGICMLWSGRRDDRPPPVIDLFRVSPHHTRTPIV